MTVQQMLWIVACSGMSTLVVAFATRQLRPVKAALCPFSAQAVPGIRVRDFQSQVVVSGLKLG